VVWFGLVRCGEVECGRFQLVWRGKLERGLA